MELGSAGSPGWGSGIQLNEAFCLGTRLLIEDTKDPFFINAGI